jgi:hypothetical protein
MLFDMQVLPMAGHVKISEAKKNWLKPGPIQAIDHFDHLSFCPSSHSVAVRKKINNEDDIYLPHF